MESTIPGLDMGGRRQVSLSSRSDDSSAYWLRRRRNNEAARRCRERRRMEEILLELHAMELLRENQRLRAALCALYPGPATSEWPVTASTCSLQPGDSRLPYSAWTLPPVYPPPPPPPPPQCSTRSCQYVPPASPLPVSGFIMPPSHASSGPPLVHTPQAAGSAPPALSSLPHKLRLKGVRPLSCAEATCANKEAACGGV